MELVMVGMPSKDGWNSPKRYVQWYAADRHDSLDDSHDRRCANCSNKVHMGWVNEGANGDTEKVKGQRDRFFYCDRCHNIHEQAYEEEGLVASH